MTAWSPTPTSPRRRQRRAAPRIQGRTAPLPGTSAQLRAVAELAEQLDRRIGRAQDESLAALGTAMSRLVALREHATPELCEALTAIAGHLEEARLLGQRARTATDALADVPLVQAAPGEVTVPRVRPRRVLVVDGSRHTAPAVGRMLPEAAVLARRDPAELCPIAHGQAFDLVLFSELGDGTPEALQPFLAAGGRLVALLAGSVPPALAARAASGALGLLHKPFSRAELLALLG